MARGALALVATLLLDATPALAAEPSATAALAERIAFGLVLVGGLVFFAWVAWLTLRR